MNLSVESILFIMLALLNMSLSRLIYQTTDQGLAVNWPCLQGMNITLAELSKVVISYVKHNYCIGLETKKIEAKSVLPWIVVSCIDYQLPNRSSG